MLRIERIGKRLISFGDLQKRSLEEFHELGDFIANSPAEFFGDIGESLLLVGNGLRTADDAESNVDALGVDRDGVAVVVIILSANAESPAIRAINLANRVAAWDRDEFVRRIGPAKSLVLRAFLAENYRNLNKQQRVILIAENFSQRLLGAASSLSSSHHIDIACVEVTLAYDTTSSEEFLKCRLITGQPAEPAELKQVEPQAEEHPAKPKPLPEKSGVEKEPAPGSPFSPEGRAIPRRTEFTSTGMTVQYAGRGMRAGLVGLYPAERRADHALALAYRRVGRREGQSRLGRYRSATGETRTRRPLQFPRSGLPLGNLVHADGSASIRKLMSTARTECVRAPLET